MKNETCTNEIKSYANCVIQLEENGSSRNNDNDNSNNNENGGTTRTGSGGGGVSHGSCNKEFILVKECFLRTKRKIFDMK